VAVLRDGRLQQVASPTDLYERPDNLFVAGFIGSPAMNIAEVSVREEDGTFLLDLQESASIAVDPAGLERYPRVKEYVGRTIAVGIRPEHFASVDEVAPDRVWRGLPVQIVEALGAESLVHVGTSTTPVVTEDMRKAIDDEDAFAELKRQAAAGGQRFVLRFDPREAPKAGERIDVGVRTERIHFFDLDSGRALR
jgi:multiple sugar transport system ATP-binding protein